MGGCNATSNFLLNIMASGSQSTSWGKHRPQEGHSSTTKLKADKHGCCFSAVLCLTAQRMRFLHVALKFLTSHMVLQPDTVPCVVVVTFVVFAVVFFVVLFAIMVIVVVVIVVVIVVLIVLDMVWVTVVIVWVEVDGQPRPSYLQHQRFQSGVQAVSHILYPM